MIFCIVVNHTVFWNNQQDNTSITRRRTVESSNIQLLCILVFMQKKLTFFKSCEQILSDPVLLLWATDTVEAAHPTIFGDAINPNPFSPDAVGRDPPFRAFGVEFPNTVYPDFCKRAGINKYFVKFAK